MSTLPERTLLANLGAEEGDGGRRMATASPVQAAASLWASLFGSSARREGAPASPWDEPAFDWLPTQGGVAWWADESASAALSDVGPPWPGTPPESVAAVHDKAFALREGALPPALRGIVRAFEPGELRSQDEAVQALRNYLKDWPPSLRRRFCLKPRLGSSGRGREGERGQLQGRRR